MVIKMIRWELKYDIMKVCSSSKRSTPTPSPEIIALMESETEIVQTIPAVESFICPVQFQSETILKWNRTLRLVALQVRPLVARRKFQDGIYSVLVRHIFLFVDF